MSEAIEFERDLYRGAAADYDRFRVAYPQSMMDDLLERVQPSGRGWLLDLACGTGQITFAVSGEFAEVWAVDQEPNMVDMVRKKAAAAAAGHVRTVISAAEKLAAPAQAFELVAVGNAFHRIRRETVATSAFEWLQPGGFISQYPNRAVKPGSSSPNRPTIPPSWSPGGGTIASMPAVPLRACAC